MDFWLTVLPGLMLLIVSRGHRWGIGWIGFLQRLDSYRARPAIRGSGPPSPVAGDGTLQGRENVIRRSEYAVTDTIGPPPLTASADLEIIEHIESKVGGHRAD